MSAILPDLSQKSPDELIAIIQAMAASKQSKLTLRVSAKGALAVYGLGQWPITLYRSQWERLLPEFDNIRAFLTAHAHELTIKA